MNHAQLMRAAGVAVLALWMTSPAPAAVVNLNPVRDATLVESATGSLANGAGSGIFAGRTNELPGVSIRRALIAFDVSGINPAATINSVSLALFCSNAQGGARTVELHKVTADWSEGPTPGQGTGGGQGGTAQTGDVTWLHRTFNSVLWATPGGDFSTTASASQTVNMSGSTYTWTSAQMVADVQDWINNPGNNFGWILIGDESAAGTAKRFDSREGATVPVLAIDLTPPSAVDDWVMY
ncbi:MAG: hypothetical protein Kow0059_01730 [Candidatus Sumerlaeia bacterium]